MAVKKKLITYSDTHTYSQQFYSGENKPRKRRWQTHTAADQLVSPPQRLEAVISRGPRKRRGKHTSVQERERDYIGCRKKTR